MKTFRFTTLIAVFGVLLASCTVAQAAPKTDATAAAKPIADVPTVTAPVAAKKDAATDEKKPKPKPKKPGPQDEGDGD